MLIVLIFYFYSVTINKTSDLDNNTDTLKKLSAADKPNNQSKLASMGATPLPPSQMKCNILKGIDLFLFFSTKKILKKKSVLLKIVVVFAITARAEEEATSTPIKLTKQLFVKPAINTNNLSNTNNLLNGEDSMSAATFVSVVSEHISREKKTNLLLKLLFCSIVILSALVSRKLSC